MSLEQLLGRTDLAKGQESRPGGCGDFPPGWVPLAGAGGQGSLASCRRPYTRAHTHPLRARGRARALAGAHAHGYKAAGGGKVRADRADGRRGRRHPRRGTPRSRRLYRRGPARQSPQPPGQPNPSLTPARPGRYRAQRCSRGPESQLPGSHCSPVQASRVLGASKKRKGRGCQPPLPLRLLALSAPST